MLDVGKPVLLEDASFLADALADYGAAFLEEPLSPDDLGGFAALTARAKTPTATVEKETTRFDFRDLMERGGLRIIQPDIARCGGLPNSSELPRSQKFAVFAWSRIAGLQISSFQRPLRCCHRYRTLPVLNSTQTAIL